MVAAVNARTTHVVQVEAMGARLRRVRLVAHGEGGGRMGQGPRLQLERELVRSRQTLQRRHAGAEATAKRGHVLRCVRRAVEERGDGLRRGQGRTLHAVAAALLLLLQALGPRRQLVLANRARGGLGVEGFGLDQAAQVCGPLQGVLAARNGKKGARGGGVE